MSFEYYPEPLPSQWNGFPAIDPALSDLIDPTIKDSTTNQDAWNARPPLRFVAEHNKASYQTYNMDQMFPSGARQQDGIAPFPSALIPRSGSPSDHLSSVSSSSMRSPPGESDYEHLPATPPDDMASSPFHGPYDMWNQTQTFHLTGLTDICVKPGDVNLIQDYPVFGDDRNPHFPGREYSMSSHGTSYDIDQFGHSESVHIPRHSSPIEFSQDIKEEISIPRSNYPNFLLPTNDLDEQTSEQDEGDTIEVAPADDGDEDYKPQRQPKRPNSTAGRGVRGRKRSNNSPSTQQPKKVKVEADGKAANIQPSKSSFQSGKSSFVCKECDNLHFLDESGLEKHIKQLHTRPFVCVFSFAGCESTFASKNEWKRHVASQHLLLNYWLCDLDACAKVSNSPAVGSKGSPKSRFPHHPSSSAFLPHGAIFNRKDLYTQHLRRMHVPPSIKKQVKQKKTVQEWEDKIREYQEQAHKLRCQLPIHMDCPATGCTSQFTGQQAWDDRMEHVAKHLEKAAAGSESPVVFGGELDPTLTEWAARPEVAVVTRDEQGRWKLNNPLKHERSTKSHAAENDDEDAEGEEVDE